MYQKGVKRQEERDRQLKQLKESEERRLQEALVFRPQLVSRGPRAERTADMSKEEELILYGKMLNEKKEMARVINMQYEDSKFDFLPKINKKSEQIVQEKVRY